MIGRRRVLEGGAIALAIALAVALGAHAGTQTPPSGPPLPLARAASGSVSAIFAGSLLNYMEHDSGPAFAKATGYGYRGFGGGSTEVATQIKDGVREGDVFISASASADARLEGAANGNWVSWYTAFASSPLVLAYDPHSSLGRQLARGRPWYEVLTEPGILVGRTDPRLDPKGILTVEAVEAAARKLSRPALKQALSSFSAYPETALVGRLQSGQLDAGFFYAVEAASAHLVSVPLGPVYKYASYTVTLLNRAANPAGGAALIRYLLNAQRRYALRQNGLVPVEARFSGRRSAVPVSLRKLVGAFR